MIILAASTIMLSRLVFDIYANNKTNDGSASVGLIEVQILVADETGQPINNAEILFFKSENTPVQSTDSQGYVKIEIPQHSASDVIVRKQGFLAIKETLKSSDKENMGKIYILRKNNQVLRGLGQGSNSNASQN
ncbi:hypothetical protein [Microseira wollei]|uniref:Carboxypeptidase regulatory-like domain-containing protein n=1 Tax=Microseira wollei NIES-4236 TaxID=2530354 RepID=A0AAV3XKR4_9CYAN|nr:hypothetical protein [Microseira wollei]GET41640.1 hypothetical protein MiSe_64530 [Microseira wollei NIES-4236]